MRLENCNLIQFKKIADARGCLTPIEGQQDIPFAIKRTYFLYDVTSNTIRGGHAHVALEQVLLAIHGSFDVMVTDGNSTKIFTLNQPNMGLFLPTMVWRELYNFSNGAVCLVLASEHYDENDYYRDYDSYIKAIQNEHPIL
jgi:dTDP-4-dehydrorhamnose 3,5-epimerase-like enzyme